jgi:enoyl-CoA hydratase/carnithine racemase
MSEDSDVVAEPRGVVDAVEASFSPGIIRIRLQRPPVNALTVQIIDRIRATFAAIHDDPRPVMLCGLPRVFSAGFDVKAPADDPHVASDAATACLDAVRTHPGPTVAAVEGAAVGLGLLIAASADILVTSRSASFRMPEVTLGIASDCACRASRSPRTSCTSRPAERWSANRERARPLPRRLPGNLPRCGRNSFETRS